MNTTTAKRIEKVKFVIDGSCDNPFADRRHTYEVTFTDGSKARVKAECEAEARKLV